MYKRSLPEFRSRKLPFFARFLCITPAGTTVLKTGTFWGSYEKVEMVEDQDEIRACKIKSINQFLNQTIPEYLGTEILSYNPSFMPRIGITYLNVHSHHSNIVIAPI